MNLLHVICSLLAACAISALPTEPSGKTEIATRADASLVGYLGIFFLGDEPSVYFYLSNGNNAFSFKPLNQGQSVLSSSLGTTGVRDPSIISGDGAEAGKKWYIIGTDLDISKVCMPIGVTTVATIEAYCLILF